ncbi:protein of unknown function [Aminobacter niigataensis]|nr:protein of unknown function [Aminobacter niigataensis]
MDLNRARADVEIVSDCLVWEPRDNGRKHLTLPLAQGGGPSSNGGNVFMDCYFAKAGGRAINRSGQNFFLEWFLDKIERAGLHRFNRQRDVPMPSNYNGWNGRRQLAKALKQFDPIQVWHTQIGHQTSIVDCRGNCQERRCRFMLSYSVPSHCQQEHQ